MAINQFIAASRACEELVRRATARAQLPIIETIFFSDFGHTPVVRIDGTGMDLEEARRIEAASPLALVRLPQFPVVFDAAFWSRLRAAVPESAFVSGETRSETLADQVKKTAAAEGIELAGWRLWEIEVAGETVKARFVTDTKGAKASCNFRGIVFEFYTDILPNDCHSLLAAFDDAKQRSVLFFEYLNGLKR